MTDLSEVIKLLRVAVMLLFLSFWVLVLICAAIVLA